MRITLSAVLAVAAFFAGSETAVGAAPWFVIVEGPLLEQPVLIDQWDENAALLVGISGSTLVSAEQLEGRQYFDVALFWGPDRQGYPRDQAALDLLSSGQANQHGRFYPARAAGEPALFSFRGADSSTQNLLLRTVEPAALAVLDAHGVPTQVDPVASVGWLAVDRNALLIVFASLVMLMFAAARLRQPASSRAHR